MIRVSKTITINGVEATMLFTPRLFVMAEEKGIKIVVNTADMWQTLAAYADLCYCAALNYWTMDNDIDDFPLKREDFHVWSAANYVEFGKIMVMASEAISGKTMKELIEENKKSAEGGEDVKKKSKSNPIIRLLRRFWSVIVG
jgi:hypothetical protein